LPGIICDHLLVGISVFERISDWVNEIHRTNNCSNRKTKSMSSNSLKKTRESMLMSKAELARQANVSPITITRIESGMPCRMETKRKILLALGLKPADKHKIFKD